MSTYSIIRFYQSGDRETVKTGLTLDEAQDHCDDSETSSRTCTEEEGVQRTRRAGDWFDGYTEE